MAPLEEQLLEDVLDSLDRLFDRQCCPADTHALILATCAALPSSKFTEVSGLVLCGLEAVIKSGEPALQQWQAALDVTDDLRQYLADVLPSL